MTHVYIYINIIRINNINACYLGYNNNDSRVAHERRFLFIFPAALAALGVHEAKLDTLVQNKLNKITIDIVVNE
jgi:hypothetical protein